MVIVCVKGMGVESVCLTKVQGLWSKGGVNAFWLRWLSIGRGAIASATVTATGRHLPLRSRAFASASASALALAYASLLFSASTCCSLCRSCSLASRMALILLVLSSLSDPE